VLVDGSFAGAVGEHGVSTPIRPDYDESAFPSHRLHDARRPAPPYPYPIVRRDSPETENDSIRYNQFAVFID